MKKYLFLLPLSLLLFCSHLSAQDANRLTKIIESQTVSYEDVFYLTDFISQNPHNTLAVKDKSLSVNYKDLAFILSKTFDIDNSIMYRVFNNSRYAFKMFQADGIIEDGIDPYDLPTGSIFLFMLNDCMERYGEGGIKENADNQE